MSRTNAIGDVDYSVASRCKPWSLSTQSRDSSIPITAYTGCPQCEHRIIYWGTTDGLSVRPLASDGPPKI